MDGRCRAPHRGRDPRGDRVSDQAGDCVGADPGGLRRRSAARRCADGCRIWHQYPAARGDRRSGLTYIAGISPQTSVWPPGTAPLPPLPWSGRGRRPKLMRRDTEHHPVGVRALALGLPAASWQTISWREGSAGTLTSRFARVRVRAAHRDEWRAEPRDEEWLLIEWPEGDAQPAKYWLATVPPDMPFDRLVDLAKLRWRIERDYQELKQELGLGHYEG